MFLSPVIPRKNSRRTPLADFARLVREAYDGGKMSSTIGPRELIYAAKLGAMRADFRLGLMLAYINRLSVVDREVAVGLMQRVIEALVVV